MHINRINSLVKLAVKRRFNVDDIRKISVDDDLIEQYGLDRITSIRLASEINYVFQEYGIHIDLLPRQLASFRTIRTIVKFIVNSQKLDHHIQRKERSSNKPKKSKWKPRDLPDSMPNYSTGYAKESPQFYRERSRNNGKKSDDIRIEEAATTNEGAHTAVELYFGTDREMSGKNEPNEYFNSKLGEEFQYGIASVTIPKNHKLGEIERPFRVWKLALSEDEKKHVVLQKLSIVNQDNFFSSLSAQVETTEEKSLFIFIHGFNVTFDSAARRAAQMAYDLFLVGKEQNKAQLSTTPVLYSWSSAGETLKYDKDEESVEASVTQLKTFIRDIRERSSAEKIIVIAHSMGNRALIQALKELGLAEKNEKSIVDHVFLAAPDISTVIFKNSIVDMSKVCKDITLYASNKDKALNLSKTINGYPRLGHIDGGIYIDENMDSIDASIAGGDVLAHSYYGQTTVMRDIYEKISLGVSADKRFGLESIGLPPQKYWRMRG